MRTIELDEEAYEILSRKKREDQSFSEAIKKHFREPGQGTGADLLRMADKYLLSEETLDAIEEVVQSRRQSPTRIVDLD